MRILVKLCGIHTLAALEGALEAGADALGFVLVDSPRRVSLAEAEKLLARVPAGIERVAVFARASRAELSAALCLPFDALQAELASDVPELPAHVHFLPVLRDGPELETRVLPVSPAPAGRSLRGALVLDGPGGGGRGLPADPARAARLARRVRLVLAGGLAPENVHARCLAVRPFAVDASSGLELERGRKDPARMHAFVRAVRAAELELSSQPLPPQP